MCDVVVKVFTNARTNFLGFYKKYQWVLKYIKIGLYATLPFSPKKLQQYWIFQH